MKSNSSAVSLMERQRRSGGIDAEPSSISYHIREKTAEYQSLRLTVQTALPDGIGESWEFILHCDGAEIPLTGSPEQSVALPGGSLSLNGLTPVSDTTALLTDGAMFPPELYAGYSWWRMDAVWQGEDPERILAAAPVSVAFIEANDTAGTILRTEQTDTETGHVYSLFSGLLFGASQKADSLTLEFSVTIPA